MLYYQSTTKDVFQKLKTSKDGLSNKEVLKRQKKYGLNKLEEKNKVSPWKIFFDQFKSTLIVILVVATIVSALVGEAMDAIVIMIIVVLNAIFGFVQEYKAEKAIESLRNMMNPKAKVLRNGKKVG